MSRRWRYPRSRRGQIFPLPPAPSSAPGDHAGSRPRVAVRLRRGGAFVAPLQADAPPAYRSRRRPAVSARRGRFWAFVPAQVVVAPPRPPDVIGHDRLRLARSARSRFTAVPQASSQPPATVRARSRWFPAVRRGRFLPVPSGAERQATSAAVARRRTVRLARGRFFTVIATPAPSPPPRAPDRVGYGRPRLARPARAHSWAAPSADITPVPYRTQRRWTLRMRRGAFLAFVPTPVVTPSPARPPDSIGHDRVRPGWQRRARLLSVPTALVAQATPVFVPPVIARRRPSIAAFRRGHFLALPVTPTVPAIPVYVPALIARRRPFAGAVRHGRCFTVPSSPAWVPPITATRRPASRPVRRGRFTVCPNPLPTPPGIRRRPTAGIPGGHGHRFDPPWTAGPTRAPNRVIGRHLAPALARRRRYAEPPWLVARPFVPPPVHTRRRIISPRRGCFWRWSIFQAEPPALIETEPTATETHLRRRTAAETAITRRDAAEAAAGRRTAVETITGRLNATEAALGRDDA